MKNKHSYATQLLHERKIKLFQGEKQILKYKGNPKYNVEYPVTGFFTGTLEDVSSFEEIKKYSYLKKLGFCIVKKGLLDSERCYPRQQYRLILVRYRKGIEKEDDYFDRIPKEHTIIYDPEDKRAVLIGKQARKDIRHWGMGNWVYLKPRIIRMKYDPSDELHYSPYTIDPYTGNLLLNVTIFQDIVGKHIKELEKEENLCVSILREKSKNENEKEIKRLDKLDDKKKDVEELNNLLKKLEEYCKKWIVKNGLKIREV